MSRRRKRTKTLGDVIRLIVMLAALAVFLYSGYTLYGFYKEYKKSSDEYDNLENSYAADQEQESENIDNLEDDDALQSISGQEVRTVFEDGEEKTLPVLKNPIDFTQLLSVNSDIVGWLRIRARRGLVKRATRAETARGIHPPERIFEVLARNMVSSNPPTRTAMVITRASDHFHTVRAKMRNRDSSSSRVPVTASPYADASRSDEPKAATRAKTPTKRIPFTAGRYTCPPLEREVCTILMRGRRFI